MNLRKIEHLLILAILFLLPWQTRYIWQYGQLGGGVWEYGTFSIYGVEVLLWLVVILFFIRQIREKKVSSIFLVQKNRRLPIIFLLLMALSLAFSENFWVSYQYVFRWLEVMAFAVVVNLSLKPVAVCHSERSEESFMLGMEKKHGVRDPSTPLRFAQDDKFKNGRLYFIALWSGGIVQGLLAIYQFLNQSVFASKWLGMAAQEAVQGGASVVEFADQRWLRAYGSFGSPNSLGIYLAILLVVGFILYLKIERSVYKIFITIGQLIIVSGLLLSFSRGAWLAALVGIICLAIIVFVTRYHSEPRKRDKFGEEFLSDQVNNNRQRSLTLFRMTMRKDFIKHLFFILAVASLWIGFFYPVFTARFNTQNRLEARSITERKNQYQESLSFIELKPFFGVGPGAYTFAVAKKYPQLQFWQLQPVHNIYLLSIAEFGILFAVVLGFILINFVKQVSKNNLVFLPVLITLLAAGLFDHWLFTMFSGLLLWWVILALSLEKIDS